jgi:hypothetical protein
MSARTFISLMLVLLVFTGGLFVYAAPIHKQAETKECPAGTACSSEDAQTTAADGLMWESVSRHLLNVIQ